MDNIRQQARQQIRAVEDFLREWDPIGVIPDLRADGLPPDEYDSYAPHVVGMLQRGVTAADLAKHLGYCRTSAMGLSPNDAADHGAASKILAWWQREQERG